MRWLFSHGYPVPVQSNCVGCPYHSDAEWAALTPEEFEDACQFDEAIRDKHLHASRRKDFKLYLHRSLTPLRDVKLRPTGENLDKQAECQAGCWL